jgi:hypothetical protein
VTVRSNRTSDFVSVALLTLELREDRGADVFPDVVVARPSRQHSSRRFRMTLEQFADEPRCDLVRQKSHQRTGLRSSLRTAAAHPACDGCDGPGIRAQRNRAVTFLPCISRWRQIVWTAVRHSVGSLKRNAANTSRGDGRAHAGIATPGVRHRGLHVSLLRLRPLRGPPTLSSRLPQASNQPSNFGVAMIRVVPFALLLAVCVAHATASLAEAHAGRPAARGSARRPE